MHNFSVHNNMSAHATDPDVVEPHRRPLLSVQTSTEAATAQTWSAEDDEPLSPTARMFQDIYIVVVVGVGTPINHAAARAGLASTLVHHPRFCSIRVMDELGNKASEARWVRTTVNLDDHVVFPDLDPAATAANPDQVVEDYVASLSTLPMDLSRPLWEYHVLDFPTSEAAATIAIRVHHALGDGISLMSLVLACTRSAADPTALPALPPVGRAGAGPHYAPPRSLGAVACIWYYLLLVCHTVVDVARFVATVLFLRDPKTVFTGVHGVELRRKRFVSRSLSLDDIKHVKNVLNCTVNDVLVGVTSAALSRYYFRKHGDRDAKSSLCLRSVLMVNIRPAQGIHALAKMMETSKDNDARWGNKLGYIILPFHIAMYDDPLKYVHKAKEAVDRKKHSLEAILTRMVAEVTTNIFGVKAAGALFCRMISSTTMAFSSMVGPVEEIEFYGHPVVYLAPSVYGHPAAVTTVWQSYMNTIRISLALDDAQFPDCHQLLDDFAESLKLIKDATSMR